MPNLNIQSPARWARRLLEILAGLLPAIPVAYLYLFQDPSLRFQSLEFHELAMSLALLEGAFISYASWRCYVHSGEVFVKWLTLGFIGFTVVYSLHGVFTPIAGENIWLFLLYGPASRLLMSACLLLALLKSGGHPDAPEAREDARYWMSWFGLFLAINVAVAVLANSPLAGMPWVRLSQEGGSVVLCLTGLGIISLRGYRSPLMTYYSQALAWFAVSSCAFVLAAPWNHLWWLAHGIFAGGFSILGYGVLKAYLTTQSFDRVFNENELFEDLAQTNARLQETTSRLMAANRLLEAQMHVSETAREQFAALFDVSPDGIVVVEQGGSILKSNPRAEEMFGYSRGALTGLPVEALIPQDLRSHHARTRTLYEYSPVARPMGSMHAPLDCLHKDGHTFRATISISGLVFEGRQCVVTFIRDVGLLLASEERQRQADVVAIAWGRLVEDVVALMPGLVFQFLRRPDGGYGMPFVSPKALAVLEIDAEQLMKQGPKLLFSRVHPGDLAGVISDIEQASAARSPWLSTWRTNTGDRGMLPFEVHTGVPVGQPDGSLLWTGYLRCTRERHDDAPNGDQAPDPGRTRNTI